MMIATPVQAAPAGALSAIVLVVGAVAVIGLVIRIARTLLSALLSFGVVAAIVGGLFFFIPQLSVQKAVGILNDLLAGVV